MRIAIKSTDRLGISQEILAIFSKKCWNLLAIEVVSQFTYVHIEEVNIKLTDVHQSLAGISGVISCEEVELLPTESREKHLKTLLDRLPDPILDVDKDGRVITINHAAERLFNVVGISLTDGSIQNLFGISIDLTSIDKPLAINIEVGEQSYVADINPVITAVGISGAVVTLKTMSSLGRQMSIMQSPERQGVDSIIGESQVMRQLIAQTIRFSELDLPVLISGETGTGKELIARALHNNGQRAKAPFLAVNCAALSEHLLESELFGYASGAFTGAKKGGKAGLIELAEGGTVFLDEIAEMSNYLQAKLLRFLQDYRYRRVGGVNDIKANVRIISATHQNLIECFAKQSFREDLYYRLNVLNLTLPPLRERREDIPLLISYFIKQASIQVNRETTRVSAAGLKILKEFSWPGNIRQLQNVLFRLVALNQSGTIENIEVKRVLFDFSNELVADDVSNGKITNWAEAQAIFEKDLLVSLYPRFPTTRQLAQRLGVSHNKIAMKLRQYGLNK